MKTNPFPYSNDNKRYHTLNYHNLQLFGGKVYKAVIDGGFSCPNIDGTKGFGGCIYCDGGSGYFTSKADNENLSYSVVNQINSETARIREKHKNAGIIAYFQSHTNTYAPISTLKTLYNAALSCDIKGISIGTRADCISIETLDYLEELSKRTSLTVELGLQTIHSSTEKLINRCHTYEEFLQTYSLLKQRKIRTCVHIINGLPLESTDMMMETAKEIGRLKPDGIKIHLLHVIKGTPLAEMLNNGEFSPMSKEQYIQLVVNQLEYIPQECVIERITGDGDKSKLIAPLWSMDKISVLGGIDKRQAELSSYQGKLV